MRPFCVDRADRKCGRLRGGLLAALILTAVSAAASAQPNRERINVDTGGLTIEAEAGWSGLVDQNSPVSVSFLISNYSGRDIDGELILSDPIFGRRVSLGDVYISHESSRRVSTIQAMPHWLECFATLESGREVLWRRELPVNMGGFDADSNYVLCVDSGARAAPLPELQTEQVERSTDFSEIAPKEGRRVQCLGVRPWQLPRHPGPFSMVQAILFPEGTSAEQLSTVQYQAVADWLCQGGTVFVHSDSAELIRQLVAAAPLDVSPPVLAETWSERRAGLGTLIEFSFPVYASSDTDGVQRMAHRISQLPRTHASGLWHVLHPYPMDTGRSASNRVLVLAFFGGYTFFSGVLTLVLFRGSRRRIAAWTMTVVLGASVLSGLLGGMLRLSPGDLTWMSMTKVGAGGAVQVARIVSQSSGGHSTQVGVTGEHCDLQSIHPGNSIQSYGYYRGYM